MDLATAAASGLASQTAGILSIAFVTLAVWQQIDDWLAPKGFVKLVIPGKQGSSDDSDTAQNATMMFYERFPQHQPADNTARQISFKSTNSHLIVYIAVTHFDKMPLYKGAKLLLSRNGGTPRTCWLRPESLLNADGFHKIGAISIPFEHANDESYLSVHRRLNTILYNKLSEKNTQSAKDIVKHIKALKRGR